MAKQPPLHHSAPCSKRKPYERLGRKRTVVGNAAIARSKRIKVRDQFTCQNKRCGVVTHQLQVDHRIAIAYGGEESDDNCQSLCVPCHRVKSILEAQGLQVKDPSDFPTEVGEAKRESLAIAEATEDVVDAAKLFTMCQQGE